MNYSYPLQSHRKCFILQHQQYTYFHVTETHKVETLFSNRWIFSFHQASFTIFFFFNNSINEGKKFEKMTILLALFPWSIRNNLRSVCFEVK